MSIPRTRRDLLLGSVALAAATAVLPAARAAEPAGPPTATGPLVLAPLPYADTALAPVISANTLSFHYGKHHRAYVDNGNKALAGNPLAQKSLPEILRATAGKPESTAIYNNVAQAWNHEFYWNSMRPGGGGLPGGRIAQHIQSDLGGYETFKQNLVKIATSRFGSGWIWIVSDGGKLAIVDTANADNPVLGTQKPLLVLDVWEHAYYLDYQNKRADYVNAWLDKLVNWEFADKNLG